MTYGDVDDRQWLEAVPRAPPATVQLEPEELDRRSALIRRAGLEHERRAALKGRPSPQARRLVELVQDAVGILEGERT